jgi:dipeptidyl aminopeptidase/acylaminoacyl peptidase
VAPYPQEKAIYIARSPIYHVEQLKRPVVFFQGLEDKVVPPNQAELMVEALRKRHLPVAYLAFAGEQHGFRQAVTIKRCLESELYFYARILDFNLPEVIEPLLIENLEQLV